MKRPVISLLTDFGASDHYVGVMKGVILGICPAAHLVDITHEIEPYAISEAAYTLAQAWRYFPDGTIHLVVVDPGVGSSRRPILVTTSAEAGGHLFVAPDNGVLTLLLDTAPIRKVREITVSRYFHQPVSQTFHGRDIFAPVAAHLASGVPPGRFGKAIENAVRLNFATPMTASRDKWTGTVLKIDRFGNLITNFRSENWRRLARQPFVLRAGKQRISRLAASYVEVMSDEVFLIEGSAGFLEISVNKGSAAALTGCITGSRLELILRKKPRKLTLNQSNIRL
jgi:S-adenosyl-L-methionine hydrolase (adenosine-forming)